MPMLALAVDNDPAEPAWPDEPYGYIEYAIVGGPGELLEYGIAEAGLEPIADELAEGDVLLLAPVFDESCGTGQ